MATLGHYRTILKNELRRRQRQNPSYSLRAFAKHIDIEPATLSRVFGGKESLSFPSAEKIMNALAYDDRKRKIFLESLAKEKTSRSLNKSLTGSSDQGLVTIDQDQFQAISKWYHYAILELTLTRDFTPSPSWMAKALGIDVIDAKLAIDRLLRLGLLVKDGAQLKKTNALVTTADRSQTSTGLREFSKTMLQMAAQSVSKDPFPERATFGITMAIDPDLLPLARQILEQSANEILATLTTGKQTRVYQLQMALFPLQRTDVELITTTQTSFRSLS